ncbi:hypothetical protein [Calothrix sp. PCC 7507]|uniref:hypothetical protein n=1 Tax=Calothrix sp. PCC 7507 TaxID=99598 RepID=UPI00029F140A|nr:hypothetical protein [Calothrix sp. PCC 7507]AFY31951.1 hypothetical protein Cal7507_1487 [Calothrix sp. PCC 7507]
MLTIVPQKIASLRSELNYRIARRKHAKQLPALTAGDRLIVDSLKRDGIHITNLAELGLASTSEILNDAYSLLPSMGKTNDRNSTKNPPKIYIVTDLPSFQNWANEQRLFNIIENYISLPVAYHGVQLRKDFANKHQFETLLWHRDIEDRRMVKIIVYLNDVEAKHGPFEYVPLSYTSIYQLNHYRIYRQLYNSAGMTDEMLSKIVPKSAWQSCPGKAGTVIFVDTRRLLHHGTLRNEERSALFFTYTANPPKQPELCAHFWSDAYPRPILNREIELSGTNK